MSNREEFEKFCVDFFGYQQSDLSHLDGDDLFRAYQAWAASYEAERNSLLSVIAEKDKALRGAKAFFDSDGDMSGSSESEIISGIGKALALTPENVRLVEVGSMQNDMRTGHTYNILFNDGMAQPIGTKLYTIVKGEAG